MNSNCCLSLSHSPPLVQYCVSPHRFQCYLKLQLVLIYINSLFVFFLPSPIQQHPPFFNHTVLHWSILCLVLFRFSIFVNHCLLNTPLSHSPHLPKGPFFRFQTYVDWLRQPNPQTLPGWVPCLQRLKLVPVYGALFLAVNSVFPLAYVRTEEFLDQNFFFRYCCSIGAALSVITVDNAF